MGAILFFAGAVLALADRLLLLSWTVATLGIWLMLIGVLAMIGIDVSAFGNLLSLAVGASYVVVILKLRESAEKPRWAAGQEGLNDGENLARTARVLKYAPRALWLFNRFTFFFVQGASIAIGFALTQMEFEAASDFVLPFAFSLLYQAEAILDGYTNNLVWKFVVGFVTLFVGVLFGVWLALSDLERAIFLNLAFGA